jgi:hypothetical protein
MAVTSALSPDGSTLLILTSGFNQNLDATGNVDPNTSNEYVFVFDVTEPSPRQVQVIQIVTNAFDGLAWSPFGLGCRERIRLIPQPGLAAIFAGTGNTSWLKRFGKQSGEKPRVPRLRPKSKERKPRSDGLIPARNMF